MRLGAWRKTIGKRRWGYSHDLVGRVECPYMRRRILWLGWITLRYHVFLRSDEDRALHDHPWWFVTLPLDTYWEIVPSVSWSGVPGILRTVRRWRPHYRPAEHRHRVLLLKSPTRTLVLTGTKTRGWGFHKDGIFYPFREWVRVFGTPACADPVKSARYSSLYVTKAERIMREIKDERDA